MITNFHMMRLQRINKIAGVESGNTSAHPLKLNPCIHVDVHIAFLLVGLCSVKYCQTDDMTNS